jgi:hypothetical protein
MKCNVCLLIFYNVWKEDARNMRGFSQYDEKMRR